MPELSKKVCKLRLLDFLKGCYFDETDKAYAALEAERTAKMEAEIRDFGSWDWHYIDATYEGVTLKHVYDMLGQHKDVQFEKACPTPYTEAYFTEFMSRGGNEIDKIEPADGIPMPEHWSEWHRDIPCEEFQTLPYKQNFVVDLHHVVADPVPL